MLFRSAPARARGQLRLPPTPAAIDLVRPARREVVGLDVFVEAALTPDKLGPIVTKAATGTAFKLKMISNRGTVVFPLTGTQTDVVDQHRCRFLLSTPAHDVGHDHVAMLLNALEREGLRWMHVEKLQSFDGKPGFTKAQGED